MSLLAWYPLISNGNNQGLDGINLETVGTVTYTAGKLGNAATFSGSYFKRARFTEQKNFSVAAWVKCSETSSVAQYCFTQGRDVNNDSWRVSFSPNGTIMVFCIGNQNLSYNVTLNAWYHVAMTIDNNANFVFYLNGSMVKSGTVTTLPDYSESGDIMSIGTHYYNNGVGYPLKGQVQDFRYYDHALSVKEVKELAKGLCLHLPLDWGGNPNMIKNSYTWMNKAMGTTNGTSTTMVVTKSFIMDDYAPCKNVLKVEGTNSGSSNTGTSVGPFFGIGTQGLTTDDLVSGETYTYSFWAKLDPSSTGNISFNPSAICESQTKVSDSGFGNLTTNWRKHTVTFNWTSTAKLTACFYTSYTANTSATYYLCGIKLEKGAKATPYVPHVEETEYSTLNFGEVYKVDCSGYNNNSTATNCVSNCSTPRGLTSTDFTAKTSHIPLPTVLNTCTALTISIWAKLDSDSLSTSSNNSSNIVALGGNEFARFRIQNEGTVCWYYLNNGSINNNFAVSNIVGGDWHHYVLVWEGGVGAKFYLDGVLKSTAINTTLTTLIATSLWKLGEYSTNSETMDGQLSDFRLYATPLSADDIKELYQVAAQIDKNGNMYCNKFIEE